MSHVTGLQPPAADEELAAAIMRREWKTAFVIGEPDSGKSTFARSLALAGLRTGLHESIALVSTDPGQPLYGPPTTVGWGMAKIDEASETLPDIPHAELAFAGSTSPYARQLDMLAASVTIIRRARAAASRVVVDTSGLASGQIGLALKRAKLDLVDPDVVILLERTAGSLMDVGRWAATSPDRTVLTAAASPSARRRTATERRKARRDRYDRYFSLAWPQRLPAGLPGAGDVLRLPAGALFAGRAEEATVHGVARLHDPPRLLAEAPWPLEHARAFVVGTVVLDDEGRESSVRRPRR